MRPKGVLKSVNLILHAATLTSQTLFCLVPLDERKKRAKQQMTSKKQEPQKSDIVIKVGNQTHGVQQRCSNFAQTRPRPVNSRWPVLTKVFPAKRKFVSNPVLMGLYLPKREIQPFPWISITIRVLE
jgi:hypothetical protein